MLYCIACWRVFHIGQFCSLDSIEVDSMLNSFACWRLHVRDFCMLDSIACCTVLYVG